MFFGDPSRVKGGGTSQIMVGGRLRDGLESENCTTEQSKAECVCVCVFVVVLYSASSRPSEKRRRSNGGVVFGGWGWGCWWGGGGVCECDRLGPPCCCVPALHRVGTEALLSDANEPSVTSSSSLPTSIC